MDETGTLLKSLHGTREDEASRDDAYSVTVLLIFYFRIAVYVHRYTGHQYRPRLDGV